MKVTRRMGDFTFESDAFQPQSLDELSEYVKDFIEATDKACVDNADDFGVWVERSTGE